jgi:hypothetical protein
MSASSRQCVRCFAAGVMSLAFLLFLAGCASGIAMSTSTPATVATSVLAGRPTRLVSGATQSYWLWTDADGVWHLRTTTAGRRRHFQGRIRPDPDVSLALAGSTIGEWKDAVALEGKDIVFNLETKGRQDGFDFRVSGGGCLELDLRIDGDGNPGRIFLGKDNLTPANSHFSVCPSEAASDVSGGGARRGRRR